MRISGRSFLPVAVRRVEKERLEDWSNHGVLQAEERNPEGMETPHSRSGSIPDNPAGTEAYG